MAQGHGAGWYSRLITDYDDIGPCVELGATYDDTLKRDDTFTAFAAMIGQRVAKEYDRKAVVTEGKWGARLESEKNPHLDHEGLIRLAHRIVRHPSWCGVTLATWVFTYGAHDDE